MQRLHPIGLGLLLSVMLGVPTVARAHSTITADTSTKSTSASAPQTPLPAKTVIEQAVKVAKADKKTVLVHIGASWCGWCHKLDGMLSSAELGPIFAAHYVLVPLTALESGDKKALENPGVDSVMASLGLQGGPPMFAFIDASGKKIASSMVMPPDNHTIGYPATPEEVKAFGDLLKQTAPRMTEADRTKITDYLTKNAPR